ncbi:MAG TPA: hypothetical protein VMU85_02045 [Stellaceae bacterium]|nr:hypothetical protein [Stellaceae bacterium]
MSIPSSTATSLGWRQFLWLGLLVVASVAFSVGFTCATPFAAFGAAAALTMARREALLLAGGVWLANQIMGFGFLRYPWDADTLAWGVFLGLAAVAATLAARQILRLLPGAPRAIAGGLAFLVAFTAYEVVLLLVAVLLLGGVEDFSPAIMGQIFAVNAAAFAGLVLLNRLGMAAGFGGSATAYRRA